MYHVFAQVVNDESLPLSNHDEIKEAVQLVQELNAEWNMEFIIRDSSGNVIDRTPRALTFE